MFHREIDECQCSKEAWDFICSQSDRIQELKDEILKLNRELCSFRGHLPITDSKGLTTCELCQEIIFNESD